jgi:hypothetical protein
VTFGLSLTRGRLRVHSNAQSAPESCDRHVRKSAIADRMTVGSAAKKDFGANSLAGGKGEIKQGARTQEQGAAPPSRMAA